MGAQSSNIRKFFVRRKASRVNTMLDSRGEYVTPHRIEGRVAPTKSGSAVRPGLRSLKFFSLDAEHSANPRNDFRCTEAHCYPPNCADTPSPRKPLFHGHTAQHHDENYGHPPQP